MHRKLIQHGESSLTISLPNKFVKRNNLKKGQELEVIEREDSLLINCNNNEMPKSIEIDISGKIAVIKNILGACYKSGFDNITILFSNFKEAKEIRMILQSQFEGFEICSQSKNTITIKKISIDDTKEFDNILRRFFRIINEMGYELIDYPEEPS
jgi:uncharacterized metal-binding protein